MIKNTLTPTDIDFIKKFLIKSLTNNQFSFFSVGTRFALNSCYLETSLYFHLNNKILELNFKTGYTIPDLNNKTFNLNDIVINLDEIILFDKDSKISYDIFSSPFYNEILEVQNIFHQFAQKWKNEVYLKKLPNIINELHQNEVIDNTAIRKVFLHYITFELGFKN